MPINTFIFIRHAETKVDKKLEISKWNLTEKGVIEALRISNDDLFQYVNIIITSNEEKAYQTAFPFSEKLKKIIIREADLNEIYRDKGKFLSNDDYLKTMKLCLENRDLSYNDWETANNALKRFSEKIKEIDSRYSSKKILIVSHGGVINLYFAKKLGQLENIYKRVLTNSFCDYGIIQNGQIIKDIAKTS